MPKYLICVLLLLGIGSATIIVADCLVPVKLICGPNQYKTPSGCWNSCSGPQYSACGDIFPALYKPSFCAYTNDGKYVSYTYECQACKAKNVLAVRNEACSCSFIKCGSKETCQNGQCVSQTPVQPIDKCALIKCGFGTVCRNSQCVSVKPDLCLTTKCSAGFVCSNGNCIKDTKPVNSCNNVKCRSS